MDEREIRRLLELAAKAYGCQGLTWREGSACFYYDDPVTGREEWQPHHDDGQSRRLEVALCLQVAVGLHDGTVRVTSSNDMIWIYEQYQFNEDSKCAATRLAVLRAAAAIGEAMP